MDKQIIEYGLIGDSTVSLSCNLDDMIKGFQANQDHDINSTWPLAADPDHYLLQSTAHDHDQAVNPAGQDLQVPWRWAHYDHYQTAEEGSCTADHHPRLREDDRTEEELEPYKEMIYRVASMQPINDVVGAANVIPGKPYRRNVRISEDPQSVAARQRRDRISQKIRILRSLVPGGSHMDTASMLDEAASYIKYLKRQIRLLNRLYHHHPPPVFASDGSPTSNYPTFQVPK